MPCWQMWPASSALLLPINAYTGHSYWGLGHGVYAAGGELEDWKGKGAAGQYADMPSEPAGVRQPGLRSEAFHA